MRRGKEGALGICIPADPWMDAVSRTEDHTLTRNIQGELLQLNNVRLFRHTLFYCTSFQGALHIPHFSQIEGL